MSAAEFRRWQIYWQHEPFGGEWRQTAMLCAMIGNSTPGRKHPVKVADFMPAAPPKREQSALSLFNFFAGIAPPKDSEQKATVEAIRKQLAG